MSIISRGSSVRELKERLKFIYWTILISFFLIAARLWFLQIYKGDFFLNYSNEIRIRSVVEAAPRGMVFDREGRILVDNRPSFDVTLTPQYIRRDQLNFVLKEVSKILGMSVGDIKAILKKNRTLPRFLPRVIKEDVSRDELARIEVNKLRIPGLDIDVVIKRTYLYGDMASHLLGYIGEITGPEIKKLSKKMNRKYKQGDLVGKAGVELVYEKTLKGDDGVNYFEVDARGRKRSKLEGGILAGLSDISPKPGRNVVLTIDLDLQKAMEASFKEGTAGAAAAINLKTGEMLAMTSKPSFDPTLFSRGITSKNYRKLLSDPLKPLRNKNVQDHYPPGSTYKLLVALAGLAENAVTKDVTVKCPGWFRLGRRTYRCWKRHGHGTVDLHKAIVESCDTFFWWLGNKLGIEVIAKYAKMFGLGSLTGINLPNEQTGLVPNSEWKIKNRGEPWIKGETLSVAIGQGYNLATPLQLLKAFSIIANDGVVYKPYYIKRIEAPNGEILKVTEPSIEKALMLSPEYYKTVKEGLFGVVQERRGTARWTRIFGIDEGGKTGTSQVIRLEKVPQKCEEQPYHHRDHAWFVGFAPIDNPEIGVVSIVEHGCHGSSAAAPIVRDVIWAYYKKYKGWEKAIPTPKQKKIIAKDKAWYKRRQEILEKRKLEKEQQANQSNSEDKDE